ncbi:MAG: histidine triad nucleotide-binding protein [Anaerolineae bacterium]|nr:MAG: histidine triad nucleotide-binding protein [Anaerolineae bacterium]
MECIFCKIVAGKAHGEVLYQDDLVTAFRDIHPIAPVHLLIVPNRHIASVNHVDAADEPALGRMFRVARQLAAEMGIAESGYRLSVNTGFDGGQAVHHLHMHLLGGRRMRRMG